MRRPLLIAILLGATARSGLRAQGLCFSGPIRTACSGFVILEGSATTLGEQPAIVSGSLGYLRVRDRTTAIGVVGQVGANGMFYRGTLPRVAVTVRWRRQLTGWTLDGGAGPLATQLHVPSKGGYAYGATLETAVMYRGYVGLMAGADLVHGEGRTIPALRGGVRFGSYGTIVASAATVLLGIIALSTFRDPS